MLIILVGPSTAGKSTLAEALQRKKLVKELKSHTTRACRGPNDYYHFVDRDEFNRIEFAERVEYAGNLYGLSVAEVRRTDDLSQNFVVVVEMHGAVQLLKLVECPTVMIFVDAPDQDIKKRLEARGTPDIKDRLALVKGERKLVRLCDHYFLNSDGYFDSVLESVEEILESGGEDVGIN